MGRNEIRLRRQNMSAGRIARHRNYDELMEKHQRHLKIRRIAIACIYLLIFICLIAVYVVVKRAEKATPPPAARTAWSIPAHDRQTSLEYGAVDCCVRN